MEILPTEKHDSFLQGGGEAGALIRSINWADTPLGAPHSWPAPLRHAVRTMLHTALPMYIAWGPHLIRLYNDAYIPSLGKTRHPQSMGTSVAETSKSLWPQLQPMFDAVLQGQTVSRKDFKIAIDKNGTPEDCYFDFTYTPIYNDDDTIGGMQAVFIETTEKVQAIQKLEASARRFQDMVLQAPVAIAVFKGPQFVAELANEASLAIIGKSKDEFIGRPLFQSMPEIKAALEPYAQEVLATGKPFTSSEFKIVINRFGRAETAYFNWVWEPLKEADGTTGGFMVVAHEITGQVLARKKAEESERSLALAIEIGELGIFNIDLKSGKATYSDKVMEWFGLREQHLTLQKIFARIHPDDRASVSETIERTISKEWAGRHNLTYRIINPRNDHVYYLRSVGQVQFEGNTAVGISGIIEDITAQIVGNRERLAAVFNASQSGMFTFAPVRNGSGQIVDFRFVITNPAFAAYVGQTPDVLNGALGSTWFPGYLTNGVFDMYRETYLTGITQRKEVHYFVDGLDLYLDLMSTKVADEVLVTFTDHTSLKSAQLQLENSVQELKRSNANLEEFAYAASHDLKEPVRKIQFFSDLLKAGLEGRLSAEEVRFFDRMESAAKRMGSLIDDLLAYSQVSQQSTLFTKTSLNEIIALVLHDLELEIAEKEARIDVGSLPEITAHPRQMQQAFQNLISNALKFHKSGEPPVITITCSRTSGKDAGGPQPAQEYWRIQVRDNGIGFEPEHSERIFNLFTRLHGQAEYRGTGIGLSIVYKVLQNHQGFITAESQPGEGAVFSLFLPVGEA